MSQHEKIKWSIYQAIDEFNLAQEMDARLDKDEQETLFSRAGFTASSKLDSLSMVYFLVTVEEHLQKEFGSNFNLKTQDLIESKEKDLLTVESLIRYVERL